MVAATIETTSAAAEAAGAFAGVLKTYGGWGMTVLLLIFIVWMFKYFMELLERRHDQFSQLIAEGTAAIKQSRDTNKNVERELERLQRRLDNARGEGG